jgi:hypothetical protein
MLAPLGHAAGRLRAWELRATAASQLLVSDFGAANAMRS